MSELENGLDKAAAAADKALDEGVGLARRAMGYGLGVAKSCVKSWEALVVGVVLGTETAVGPWAHSLFNAFWPF